MKIHVIIPAGGSGSRFGQHERKQFLTLEGRSLLYRVIQVFHNLPMVAQILVPIPFDEFSRIHDNPESLYQSEKINYVMGGRTRSVSVYQGFSHLINCDENDVVLIHDAARPLLTTDLINNVINATKEFGVAIPAIAISDTIKKVNDDDVVNATVTRNQLRAVQTPQGFLYKHLHKAYETLDFRDEKYTDEAMLMEEINVPVKIIEGDKENLKITTPLDLIVAQEILKTRG
jgi:2-C-methyl-D-erythritol 4-phosphate cytidylyltransferase